MSKKSHNSAEIFQGIELLQEDKDKMQKWHDEKINCKHKGERRSDPLGGFFCVDCDSFIDKK